MTSLIKPYYMYVDDMKETLNRWRSPITTIGEATYIVWFFISLVLFTLLVFMIGDSLHTVLDYIAIAVLTTAIVPYVFSAIVYALGKINIIKERPKESSIVLDGGPMPIIVSAACRYEGILIPGPRHWDKTMLRLYGLIKTSEGMKNYNSPPDPKDFEQGFIDQFGRFFDREEAMIIAKESGQMLDLDRNGPDETILYSEGLY